MVLLRTLLLSTLAALLALALPAQQPAGPPPGAAVATVALEDEDLARPDEECTVGVASGKATADGRPLLWKNRDAQSRHNVARWFDDAKHPYVAICDAGNPTVVWGGANAAGFCIMNSVSRDMPGDAKTGPGNGAFMKLALRECTTISEFEQLLERTAKSGRRTRANFGVIDAHGGAAIFETGHATHVRFDAAEDPRGLVVRANFATSARGDRGKDRFARATALCAKIPEGTKLDSRFLLEQFCRDLEPPPAAQSGVEGTQDVRETIHRQSTVAAMVFHGVKDGEDAAFTTMWAVLGQPLFSVAVPCWPAAGPTAPAMGGRERSALCNAALELADAFYEVPLPKPPEDKQAADAENRTEAEMAGAPRWLRVHELPALRKELGAAEDAVLRTTTELLDKLRKEPPAPADLRASLKAAHEAAAAQALKAVEAMAQKYQPAGAGR